tara:strand:- start:133 stop:468 length:336 start_codon:yes stop_codon:yes gene_type:complete
LLVGFVLVKCAERLCRDTVSQSRTRLEAGEARLLQAVPRVHLLLDNLVQGIPEVHCFGRRHLEGKDGLVLLNPEGQSAALEALQGVLFDVAEADMHARLRAGLAFEDVADM